MRLSTRLSENTSAKSTGWAKWRENVQKHVSYFKKCIEKWQISPQFNLDAKNVGTQIFPDAFHGVMASTRCKTDKDDRFTLFSGYFRFSPL